MEPKESIKNSFRDTTISIYLSQILDNREAEVLGQLKVGKRGTPLLHMSMSEKFRANIHPTYPKDLWRYQDTHIQPPTFYPSAVKAFHPHRNEQLLQK
jgi:hypothetical protein